MNELFNALLDISKLDAGAMTRQHLRISRQQSSEPHRARRSPRPRATKACSLRVVASSAWIRSDAILLEQILLNLVSNAVRYTSAGGIVVGCRRARRRVAHRGVRQRDRHCGGSAAQHLQRVLPGGRAGARAARPDWGWGWRSSSAWAPCWSTPSASLSTLGKGSRFSITVPRVRRACWPCDRHRFAALQRPTRCAASSIVVIDDDALALEGTSGLLRSWGCRVVTAQSDREALAKLDGNAPDLIISDFHLQDGRTGIDAIAELCATRSAVRSRHFWSAATSPGAFARDPGDQHHHLLHKPVNPMALRAIMSRLLKTDARQGGKVERSAQSTGRRSKLPAQRRNRQHRLGPVGDVQCLENGRHMVLHGRLGQIERAADQLVALALHHQRQHVDLPFRQAKLGR